jgi:dUTP pyrophosphatase
MSTQKYTLYVKLDTELNDDIKNYYTNYKPSHDNDSGFDLPAMFNYRIYTDRETLVFPVKSTGIQFGISCCMIDNTTGKPVGYYLYPRSSFHKYNLIVANHLGIIDAGYRGPITGMVKPLYIENDSGFIPIDQGTKLFQLCAPDLSHFDVKVVEFLPESSRGSDGFGSTGK